MDLVATPKNPIPLGASTGFIEIRKGLRIRFASWQSVLKERRGTVCILPGRTEFIEKYFEVVANSAAGVSPSPCSIGAGKAARAGSCATRSKAISTISQSTRKT